jgi:hydrophobic/amphiphilic exporter-1 (mainly G- bacteria), HAE1 family
VSEPERIPLAERLPRFSLGRRITVLVVVATALVLGAVATLGIPLELIPRGMEQPRLFVHAPWRDAPPRDVLENVVRPREEELSTVGGLQHMISVASTASGRVILDFEQGTDMAVAYREVRDRLTRARPRLPDDLERLRIFKYDESNVPVVVLGVSLDPSISDPYGVIDREIRGPLTRIDGVAAVQSQGLAEKEALIELDRDRTRAAGLSIFEVARELRGDNFALASGTIRHGSRELLLRSIARYDSLEAIRDQLIAPGVRLGDIAKVSYDVPEYHFHVRVNRNDALALEVYKEGHANTVEVGRRIEQVIEEIQQNPRLEDSFIEVLFSQKSVILESLSTLTGSGQIGALIAVAVLLFFLRRLRLTLIITLAIPLSLVIAIVVMYFAGETLNLLTLLGLIISVGLLVDNSVVVAENIYRLHQGGAPRREACIRGASEIALAVTLATLTTIIVFLPVALVEGRGQFFLLRLAIPISVSLAASLVVALVVVPLCVYLTLPKTGESRRFARLRAAMDHGLGGAYRFTLSPLSRAYERALRFFLGHRLDLVLLVAVVLIATGGAMASVNVVEVSDDDRQGFEINVTLPQGYTLEDSDEFFTSIESILEEMKPEQGFDVYVVIFSRRWGEIQVWMPSREGPSPREVRRAVMEALPKRAGVEYYSGSSRDRTERDRYVHEIHLRGDDPDVLAEARAYVAQRVREVEGVSGVRQGGEPRPNEIALHLDRDRAQRQGISPHVVAGVVATALRGQPLPRVHKDGRDVPVRIRFQEADREGLGHLADFAIPTPSGGFVQLGSLTTASFAGEPRDIVRRGKQISRTVTIDLAEEDAEQTRERLDALAASLELPEGVRLGPSVSAAQLQDDTAAMRFAALISILFIYLLMGFLFESFLLPLSIIFTVPLALVGVAWGHAITGRDLDFLGLVGVILLIGVVVNNGIVLIDYVGRLRRAGHERAEAILLAARRRFRPIMMTAGTTIGGMIPLTLGAPTSIGLSYKSFGITLIGGMVTATALTLLVVPVFYTLFDDARATLTGLVRRAVLRSPPAISSSTARRSALRRLGALGRLRRGPSDGP